MTPPAILREWLAAMRRTGVGFDGAWPAAIEGLTPVAPAFVTPQIEIRL